MSLLGPSLMVIPALVPGASTVDGVFPGSGAGEVWYDWYTQEAMSNVSAGVNTTIAAPLGHIPVFVRGGAILPLQEPAMTTRDARKNPWGLIAALGSYANATGLLYLDDGESVDPNEKTVIDVSFLC